SPKDADWMAGIGKPLEVQFKDFAQSEAEWTSMLTTYRAFNAEHHDALARTFDGMKACLDQLLGQVPLGLVTSKSRVGVERGFNTFGLHNYFKVTITADDVGSPKPAPEPVLLAAERMRVKANHCLMVGDSPHDITAGAAAGAVTGAAGWGAFDVSALRAAGPNHWLAQPKDLLELVLPKGS
ncbi:MAG: HAD-IA family hydrolase, partial [Myxococcota bacterium]